jgi:hypothetical protein
VGSKKGNAYDLLVTNKAMARTAKEFYNTEIGDDHIADMYILTISNAQCTICWVIFA